MKSHLISKGCVALAAMCALMLASGSARAVTVLVDNQNVYGVGCSGSSALDPGGNPVACTPTVNWTHTITFDENHLKLAILAITAEGIDSAAPAGSPGPEMDVVFVNGTAVGQLTNQAFYSALFNLNPGAGALAGITALTTSFFDVTSLIHSGVNNIQVVVDPTNWVLEIETSSLSVTVPEPATLAILGLGLAGLGLMRRRRAA